MSGEPANTEGGNVTKTPKVPAPLPDPKICRTRTTGVTFMAHCLVDMPKRCAFLQPFGGALYCHHPDRLKFDEKLRGNSD